MDETKRLLKNTGVIALGNLGAKAAAFLLLPLYTSLLTTEEYGLYDFLAALSALLVPLLTACVQEALFRFLVAQKENEAACGRVVFHAFALLLPGWAVFGLGMAAARPLFPAGLWLAFLLFVSANVLYTFSVNLLRGLGHMRAFALVSGGKNALQVLLNVGAVAVLRLGGRGLLLSVAVAEGLAVAAVALRYRLWRWLRPQRPSLALWRQLLGYALPLVPNTIGSQVIALSDRLVIRWLLGPSANGIYTVANKFPNAAETVYHYFYLAWGESAARLWERDAQQALGQYQRLYRRVKGLLFAMLCLLAAGMPLLFWLFVRGDYAQGLRYVPLLLLAMYFDCMAKFYAGIYTALCDTRGMAATTVAAALLNLALHLALVRWLGLYAAVLSTLAANAFLAAVRRRALQKRVPLGGRGDWLMLAVALGILAAYRWAGVL